MTPAQRRMIVPVVALVLGLGLLAATAWVTLSQRAATSVTPAVTHIGGPFALIDQNGKAITDRDLVGMPHLVFFGYTNCPDVCPTSMAEISDIFARLGPDKKIGALFITVDPQRDTPAMLKDFISNFDKRIQAASGTPESIAAVAKLYRAYYKKVPGENGEYTMDHSAIVYLMDKKGQFVSAFNLNQPPEKAAAQLQPYL